MSSGRDRFSKKMNILQNAMAQRPTCSRPTIIGYRFALTFGSNENNFWFFSKGDCLRGNDARRFLCHRSRNGPFAILHGIFRSTDDLSGKCCVQADSQTRLELIDYSFVGRMAMRQFKRASAMRFSWQ